jgi:predicted nucleic acid-binding protein
MNRLLIDTNIYSHALRGTLDIVEVLRSVNQIAISAVSIGELLSGFKGIVSV